MVAGCTTSGCVRSTVVDGMSYGFKCVVPLDCVWDRSEASHAINLFDMAQKYADVMSLNELLALLDGIPVLQTTSSEREKAG